MAKTNSNITMHGNPLKVKGNAVTEGSVAPKFKLTGTDMADVESDRFAGKIMTVVSVPSLDTPVCSMEIKKFNSEVASLGEDVVTLVVSRDLPFAQKRWCGAEGVKHVVPLSDYKYRTFGEQFGADLPDIGLLARAVFVIDQSGKVAYVDYVSEVGDEPNYGEVLSAVKKLSK